MHSLSNESFNQSRRYYLENIVRPADRFSKEACSAVEIYHNDETVNVVSMQVATLQAGCLVCRRHSTSCQSKKLVQQLKTARRYVRRVVNRGRNSKEDC